jgi:hypothetical protein
LSILDPKAKPGIDCRCYYLLRAKTFQSGLWLHLQPKYRLANSPERVAMRLVNRAGASGRSGGETGSTRRVEYSVSAGKCYTGGAGRRSLRPPSASSSTFAWTGLRSSAIPANDASAVTSLAGNHRRQIFRLYFNFKSFSFAVWASHSLISSIGRDGRLKKFRPPRPVRRHCGNYASPFRLRRRVAGHSLKNHGGEGRRARWRSLASTIVKLKEARQLRQITKRARSA